MEVILVKYGLYEKILNSKLIEEVDDKKHTKIRNIDNTEVDRVLSIEYQKRIREILLQINNNVDKIKVINKLNKIIEIDGFEYEDEKFKELLLKRL